MTEDADASSLLGEIGLPERSSSTLPRSQTDLLADALDVPAPGPVLPALWHWAFFPPRAATASLGEDGHPARPADGSLARLPRRMWAGGRLWFPGDLQIDAPTERRSQVVSVQHKQGTQGPFALVVLRHELRQNTRLCVIEEQDLAYRPSAGSGAGPQPGPPASRSIVRPISSVLLFRYAALTFNAHRIHYDLAYATEVEDYPGIVVQGPLIATLLAGLATADGGALAQFGYRATAPAFAPTELGLSVAGTAGELALVATRPDGVVAMSATATMR